MEHLCFCMFYDEFKFLQKDRGNIIAIEKQRIQNGNGFALSNEETVINKR